jgi:uncharacterized protein YyaL (SSP411 family)
MVDYFFDPTSGGFFDTARVGTAARSDDRVQLGILGTPRKPFQDSPTPAGNPAAAIALLRLNGYTNEKSYRDQAERTLALFAGGADKYGMFAATYALAVTHFAEPHTQIVIVGQDANADELYREALRGVSITKAVLHFSREAVVPENLPPTLSETISRLPALREARSFAVVCSGFTCQAPVFEAADLKRQLSAIKAAA